MSCFEVVHLLRVVTVVVVVVVVVVGCCQYDFKAFSDSDWSFGLSWADGCRFRALFVPSPGPASRPFSFRIDVMVDQSW